MPAFNHQIVKEFKTWFVDNKKGGSFTSVYGDMEEITHDMNW